MEQKVCIFEDVYSETSARAQAEREKTGAFGVLARVKLWDRPKDAEIVLANSEKRYEPFWTVQAARHTRYLRHATYHIKIEHPPVTAVKMFGQRLAVDAKRGLRLDATEDCENTVALTHYADALGRDVPEKALTEYVGRYAVHDLADDPEAPCIAPTVDAVAVVQQVESRLSTPVEADEITRDEIRVFALTLFYHPVYAFQFGWRDKTGTVEIDGLSGSADKEGSILGDAAPKLDHCNAPFDLQTDFAGTIGPDGILVIHPHGKPARQP